MGKFKLIEADHWTVIGLEISSLDHMANICMQAVDLTYPAKEIQA